MIIKHLNGITVSTVHKMMRIKLALAIAAITLTPAIDVGASNTLAAAQVSAQRRTLSRVQVDNLVLLGKVWGFAKYHHPQIALGNVAWDAELRRILPSVVAARGPATAAL